MFKYVALAKVLKKHKPTVDTAVFKLHYRTTFLILGISSALISAKEYFGSPISCYAQGSIPGDVLNVYCFIMSTFSVPRHWAKPLGDGMRVDYHGFQGLGQNDPDDEIVYHAYYQWVPLVLFAQALSFYLPRVIWKQVERGLFDVVLGGMDQPEMEESKRAKKYRILSAYMIENLKLHKFWAMRFFCCELLTFVVVIGNIFFTDFFLGGTFLKYGTESMSYVNDLDPEKRVDPMVRIFPTVAKCNFRSFGPSGTVEVMDSMCVLAVNILNQKIFILMWFWFVILAICTGLQLLFRIATIVSHDVRGLTLKYRGRMAGDDSIARIKKNCDLGDWFLLDQLGKTIEPTVFAQFLKDLSNELELAGNEDTKPMVFES